MENKDSNIWSYDHVSKSDDELLRDLETLNAERTQGRLVYSPERDTHDSIIHTEDAIIENGYIGVGDGGVVGSSEWIWIEEKDAKFFVASANAMARLLEIARKGLEADASK